MRLQKSGDLIGWQSVFRGPGSCRQMRALPARFTVQKPARGHHEKQDSKRSSHEPSHFRQDEIIKNDGTVGEQRRESNLGWSEVEVCKEYSGKPRIELRGSMITLVSKIVGTPFQVQLSLTHTKDLAEAMVILEKL